MNRSKMMKSLDLVKKKDGKLIVVPCAKVNALGRFQLLALPILTIPGIILCMQQRSAGPMLLGVVTGFGVLFSIMAFMGRKTVFDLEARTIKGRGRNLTFDDVESVRLQGKRVELGLRTDPDNPMPLVKSIDSPRLVQASRLLSAALGARLVEEETDRVIRIPARSLDLTLGELLESGLVKAVDPGQAPAKISESNEPGRLVLKWSGTRRDRLFIVALILMCAQGILLATTDLSVGKLLSTVFMFVLPLLAMLPPILRGSSGGQLVVTPERFSLQEGRRATTSKAMAVDELKWITTVEGSEKAIALIGASGTVTIPLPAGCTQWVRRRIENFLQNNVATKAG